MNRRVFPGLRHDARFDDVCDDSSRRQEEAPPDRREWSRAAVCGSRPWTSSVPAPKPLESVDRVGVTKSRDSR